MSRHSGFLQSLRDGLVLFVRTAGDLFRRSFRCLTSAFFFRPVQLPEFQAAVTHLFSWNALVVAQPLLSQLADNPRYLLETGVSLPGLLLIMAGLLLPLPLFLSGLLAAARRFNVPIDTGLLGSLVLLFALLLGGQMSRHLFDFYILSLWGIQELLQASFMLIFAAAVVWCYFHTGWLQRVVSYAALGLLLFPAAFLLNPQVLAVISPRKTIASVTISRPQPVVLIIFDGLLGTALMDEDRQVDAIRYPNFARLARSSSWFRNATTVHPRTDHAVPAILSGRVPEDSTPPVLASYPQNLLSLIHDSRLYEVISFEPYTRLTPPELELHAQSLSPIDQATKVLWTLQQLLWKISLPANVAGLLPELPREWFNLPDDYQSMRQLKTGCIRYGWDRDRGEQGRHFLECLTKSDRTRFWMAHLAVPHHPFLYFPNGSTYSEELMITDVQPGTHGQHQELWGPDELAVDQAWQRYLLQVGFADHLLGQILDRLEEQDLFDDSLLIVTADHGYSFRTNQPQRDPNMVNLPDILPIPLFVKRPHQQTGQESDRNVESIDILPTIAAEIGLELPPSVEGESVFATERPRLRKSLRTKDGLLYVEASFPRANESRLRMLRRFGSGRHDRLWTVGLRPEWIGKKVSDFPIDDQAGPLVELTLPSKPFKDRRPFLHCYFLGEFLNLARDTQSPTVVAISIAGVIRGVTRTYTDPEYLNAWSLLIPHDETLTSLRGVEIWQVIDTESGSRLRRCRVPRKNMSAE